MKSLNRSYSSLRLLQLSNSHTSKSPYSTLMDEHFPLSSSNAIRPPVRYLLLTRPDNTTLRGTGPIIAHRRANIVPTEWFGNRTLPVSSSANIAPNE